jgi:hypothetical protein
MSAMVEPVSKGTRWTGYVMSYLPAVFLLLDGVMKIIKPGFVVDATTKLGYQESVIVPIGVVMVISTVLYLLPRTSVLGAILLTGHLGGAVATHVRTLEGAFPIIFAVIIGVLLWGGLYLRDDRLRILIPLRSSV